MDAFQKVTFFSDRGQSLGFEASGTIYHFTQIYQLNWKYWPDDGH